MRSGAHHCHNRHANIANLSMLAIACTTDIPGATVRRWSGAALRAIPQCHQTRTSLADTTKLGCFTSRGDNNLQSLSTLSDCFVLVQRVVCHLLVPAQTYRDQAGWHTAVLGFCISHSHESSYQYWLFIACARCCFNTVTLRCSMFLVTLQVEWAVKQHDCLLDNMKDFFNHHDLLCCPAACVAPFNADIRYATTARAAAGCSLCMYDSITGSASMYTTFP